LFPGAAWKSLGVMAGSIMEAILYGLLPRDINRIKQAMADANAPKKKGGVVKDITPYFPGHCEFLRMERAAAQWRQPWELGTQERSPRGRS
jgi:hypothetical protein